MPVRLRITFLFTILVIIILGMVCGGVYYFSASARISTIKTRLTNRAITTARLLAQEEIFDEKLVQRIDSLTRISLKNKTVQVYDQFNRKVYYYSDRPQDTLPIDATMLARARNSEKLFFKVQQKEVITYHYRTGNKDIIIVSGGEDVEGKLELHYLRNILLASFLIGIAVIMIAGYIFSYRLLMPVRKIASDVQAISVQNLARRIKTGNTKDEWGQLANTLNELLNRLQESFELQRRFISNASHELSTPLTSILSQIEVSLQRERDSSEYKKVLLSISQDVTNISKLVHTLLEVAKASGDAGGLEINLVRMDEIILRLPSEMSKINSSYNVQLMFEELPDTEEHLLVFGNEPLLFTAIKNIVVNACKYSADHRAEVILGVHDKDISIVVKDKGIGIPETELNSIFQPFYRVGEKSANEGFGLGLSLADRIIHLHKGTITVSSRLNKGTTFAILLPSARFLR